MAKLIQCPSCKKKISIEAPACPSCGQPITDAIRDEAIKKEKGGKQVLKGCLAVIFALFVFSAVTNLITGGKKESSEKTTPEAASIAVPAPAPVESVPPQEKSKPQPVEQKTQKTEPFFNMTVKTFVANYNKAAKEAGSGQRMKVTKQNGKVAQLAATEHNGAVVSTNEQGKITSILYIGTSDGTVQTATDMLIGMAFSIGGIKPEWPAERRFDVLEKLNLINDSGIIPESSKATINGVAFSSEFSQQTGLWLTITPAAQ